MHTMVNIIASDCQYTDTPTTWITALDLDLHSHAHAGHFTDTSWLIGNYTSSFHMRMHSALLCSSLVSQGTKVIFVALPYILQHIPGIWDRCCPLHTNKGVLADRWHFTEVCSGRCLTRMPLRSRALPTAKRPSAPQGMRYAIWWAAANLIS